MQTHAIDSSDQQQPAACPSGCGPTRNWRVASWIAQILVAAILGQTLFFKLSGAPEAVALFTKLGAEPWGRYGVAAAELVAVVLLLVPRTIHLGAALAVGLMVGAIGSHVTRLGIVVDDDGGTLFAMAVVVLAAASFIAWVRRAALVASVRAIGWRR